METTNKITFEQYLINCIDANGYGLSPQTDTEKLQFLYDTFISEYGWLIPKRGERNSFLEWISGLPSSYNVEFENYQILNLGYLLGMLPANVTEEQEDLFIEQWFKMVTNETFKLFKKHGIKH